MKSRSTAILIMGITLFTMVISACMPPEASAEEIAAREKARKDSVRLANRNVCRKHLSFATEYYKNKGYTDALLNYHKLFDYECVDEDMARNVYVYMGNCYRELDQLDSAIIYYDEGLSMLPEDRYLWDSKLFALGMTGDDETTFQTKRDMFTHFPEDLGLGEQIADELIRNEDWETAKSFVDELLAKDPTNKNFKGMRRLIIEAVGGDVLGLLEEEYTKNPKDIPLAQEYARELLAVEQVQKATTVLEGILVESPDMTNVIKMLVEAYGKEGRVADMIRMLKQLNAANPEDIRIYFDITDAYILDAQLKSAMTWASKALDLDQNYGQAYANRGKVYEAVAGSCMSSVPDFDDKLVFMMAYEDYKTAKAKGYGKVNNKIDFLKEARIPQSGDWFFNKDDYVKGGKAAPKKECYAWLGRSVTAPKN